MFVQYLKDEITKDAKIDKDIDFSKISSSTNGQGVYLRSGTENNKNPIYYYRGNITNNNVKFANLCWKIVRTTETGGIKLIYNGTSYNGYCNRTGSYTQIGTSYFNSNYASPTYVGYMYGPIYNRLTKAAADITAGIVYGNDIEYKDGKYHLKDKYISENGWEKDYTTISTKYHYTCFSTEDSCETVNYIYNAKVSSVAYYFELAGGKTHTTILDEMVTNSTNENNSTIKTYVDTWYSTNMINYTSYLEDTVWCNDRSIYQLNGWDKDKNATDHLTFSATKNLYIDYAPKLDCSNRNDSFTVSSENGNGKLTYPVSLLTTDEITLAGSVIGTNSNFYLKNGYVWWTITPNTFAGHSAFVFYLDNNGNLTKNSNVKYSAGVRPTISLKSWIDYISGTGTTTNPYVIETN